jgi:hypothetical protein
MMYTSKSIGTVAMAAILAMGSIPSARAAEDQVPDRAPSTTVQIQAGMLKRVSGGLPNYGNSGLLFSIDLLMLGGMDKRRSFGFGPRVTANEDGVRLGISLAWRGRPRVGSHLFWQLAPGMIVTSTDNGVRTIRPSPYITAQFGDDRYISVCVSVEMLVHEKRLNRWFDSPVNGSGSVIATDTSWYVGGVLHKWFGLGGVVALLALAGASMGSMGSVTIAP